MEVAPNYQAVHWAVAQASHDVVWAPPLICGQVVSGVRATLTAVRGGSMSSRAALVVQKSGDIEELSDLYGTRAAWVDKLSMGGYRSATALLRQEGHEPSTMFRDVGFCGSYRDAILAVAAGHAEVTSVYAGIHADHHEICGTLEDIAGDAARSLRVLCRTPPAPYDALVLTKRTSPSLAASFERQVLALRRRPRVTPPALLVVCQCEGFSRLHESAYAWLEHGTSDPVIEPASQWAAAR